MKNAKSRENERDDKFLRSRRIDEAPRLDSERTGDSRPMSRVCSAKLCARQTTPNYLQIYRHPRRYCISMKRNQMENIASAKREREKKNTPTRQKKREI